MSVKKILTLALTIHYFKNGKGRIMRANILKKIEQLQDLLSTKNLSTYCRGRIETNIKALQRDLDILDTDGEIIMIQQIRLEASI